jgi:hypothetical protein
MNVRRLHRLTGLVMLLPFIGWAITGAVFFIKPGYGPAYDLLAVKTYPLDGNLSIAPQPGWREVRYLKTILGPHLLVRTDKGWSHLNPSTLAPAGAPADEDVRRFVADAFSANPGRYGHITSIADGTIRTDTGVEIVLDWTRLSLQQRGRDTDRIDRLYKIHYLQWTGQKSIDKVLGLAGLSLLVLLTVLGARIAWKS